MNNNFNNMDDLFNQLMGNMGGFRSESRRYMINGREVTPEEFAIYRQTGQFPADGSEQTQHSQAKGMKQDGILAKLGRNWIRSLDVTKKFKKWLKSCLVVPRTIRSLSGMLV